MNLVVHSQETFIHWTTTPQFYKLFTPNMLFMIVLIYLWCLWQLKAILNGQMEIWGKILEVFCWAWSWRCRAESVFRVGDSRDLPQPRVATSKHATALCSSPFNFSLQGLTGTSTFLSSFFPFHPSLAHSLSIFLSVCLSFLSFCLYVLVFLFLLTYGYF